MKPRVFVTRLIPEAGLAPVRDFCDADIWQDEVPPSRLVLKARVRGVAGILSLLTDRIDAEIMEAAGSQLRVISNMAVGYDNVDIAAATGRGIPVGNTPGVLTETTADMAFALLMAAARRVVEADRYTRTGRWRTWGPLLMLGQDIAHATLGIVGFGRIGRALARRAMGFDMRILFCDPGETGTEDPATGALRVDLPTLLSESDFISLHTPLNAGTRYLIDAAALRQMKPSAILINTARGAIVDPAALYLALRDEVIAGAALDVTDPEPLEAGSPLLTLSNLIITPHIASASVATRGRMARMAAENLIAGLRDQRLPNCINPQVYDTPA